MSSQPNLDAPISKLDRDLLWRIFLINTSPGSWYPPFKTHLSPLSITRRCSQVCHFWREIMLESSSVWGNCIDLDVLGQAHDDWRHEVLRRTGGALLAVQARVPIIPNTGPHGFFIHLIHDHWSRIRKLDIAIGNRTVLNDPKIWTAFSLPACHLEAFTIDHNSLTAGEESWDDEEDGIHLPADFRFFSDDAPFINVFSLPNFIIPFNLRPFPSFLQTGHLRELSLNQPVEFEVVDLLSACVQMPLLERLRLKIVGLILDELDNRSLAFRQVFLPRLIMVAISATTLDIYPEFLARIVPHTACMLHVDATVDSTEGGTGAWTKHGVEAMQRVIAQYANGLFNFATAGTSDKSEVRDLGLAIFPRELGLKAHQYRFDYRLRSMSDGDDSEIPSHVMDSVISNISSLNFPDTIDQLNLFISPDCCDGNIAVSLLRMFLALGSVEELVITARSLTLLAELSGPEAVLLFPSLKVIFLRGLDIREKEGHIKPFLANRQHTAPIQILDLSKCRWPLGDLRFLDNIKGLRVVWQRTDSDEVMGYVCGSGKPGVLLLGEDGEDDFNSDNDSSQS